MGNETNSNRVYIFDTTLRDGEQSPGASMNLSSKNYALQKFWRIWASDITRLFRQFLEGDFKAVNEIAKVVPNSVCGSRDLVRLTSSDVQRR